MLKGGGRRSDAKYLLAPWSVISSIACQMVERQGPTELTLQELAGRLAMPEQTLYRWLRRGLLAARRAVVRSHPVWLVTADETEIERLRALRQGRTSRSYPGSTDPVGPQLRLDVARQSG